ncbi:unnamed protein product [Brachionus calyciflorus]|uniref:Fzo/mitofusin HR2 domain-containing protein n=1 Tax=Brachionus calyciflorus TaxID=104777 RepID=A0A814IBR3_9BILA|nr:unnamed protein product [Brachionus calyciflorus]
MSAVKTKFDQPAQRGKIMAATLKKTLDESHQKALDKKQNYEHNLQELIRKIEEIDKKLQDFTQEVKKKIRNVMDEVEANVSMTLYDEIKKLNQLIDEYERPFHPEENQLNWYKKELHKFVEQRLGYNLTSRLNSAILDNLEFTQKDIRTKVLDLVVSDENRKLISNTLPRSDFLINYRLDCTNLCADFQEDVSFHFSLGFTALMRRFTGNKNFNMGTTQFFMNSPNLFRSQHEERKEVQATSSSNLNPFHSEQSNFLVLLQGFQMVASKSNVILFAVGGVVWRGLGWKILAVTGSLYGLCYLYERLMWTRKTQEKVFKKQYADYASSKLKLIVDLTSQNAASQVQQELAMYFAQMCRYIDITKDEYFEEMKKYEEDIHVLNKLLGHSKILKNKGKYIHDEFDKFIQEYLANIQK